MVEVGKETLPKVLKYCKNAKLFCALSFRFEILLRKSGTWKCIEMEIKSNLHQRNADALWIFALNAFLLNFVSHRWKKLHRTKRICLA